MLVFYVLFYTKLSVKKCSNFCPKGGGVPWNPWNPPKFAYVYALIADEVTDWSNKKPLCIVLWYVEPISCQILMLSWNAIVAIVALLGNL